MIRPPSERHARRRAIAFIGDSPKDEPMFTSFRRASRLPTSATMPGGSTRFPLCGTSRGRRRVCRIRRGAAGVSELWKQLSFRVRGFAALRNDGELKDVRSRLARAFVVVVFALAGAGAQAFRQGRALRL